MANRLWIAAARQPARSEPVNSQFFLPMAIGRLACSTGLLSIGSVPELALALQRRPAFERILDCLGSTAASGEQHNTLAGGDLFDPVQRQMIKVFAGRDPRQQTDGSHTAIDDGRQDSSGCHRRARAASVLRTDMAVHEEALRFHVELLADILVDLDQVSAALARLGFMAVLYTL